MFYVKNLGQIISGHQRTVQKKTEAVHDLFIKKVSIIQHNKNVSGYVCNHVSPRGNETLRPLGVAIGEGRQRDPCLKHTYIKTPPVGRRQPTTSLPARPRYKGRRENTSLTSSSEACIRSMAHSLGEAVSRSPSGKHGYIRNLRRSHSTSNCVP